MIYLLCIIPAVVLIYLCVKLLTFLFEQDKIEGSDYDDFYGI